MTIVTSNSSESKFIFNNNFVLKRFPIESGLHYDIAIRFFEYYKTVGLPIEYDVTLLNSSGRIGFFTTKFPKIKIIEDKTINGKEVVDSLIEKILKTYPIPTIQAIQNEFNDKKVTVHCRDTKDRNLFTHKNEFYLLDIADFYFTVENCELPQSYIDANKIVPYTYKADDKYIIPVNAYTYKFEKATEYE